MDCNLDCEIHNLVDRRICRTDYNKTSSPTYINPPAPVSDWPGGQGGNSPPPGPLGLKLSRPLKHKCRALKGALLIHCCSIEYSDINRKYKILCSSQLSFLLFFALAVLALHLEIHTCTY